MQFSRGLILLICYYEVNDGSAGHTTVLTSSFHRMQSATWMFACTDSSPVKLHSSVCVYPCLFMENWPFLSKVEPNKLNIFIKK